MVRFFACLVGFALSLGWPLTTGSAANCATMPSFRRRSTATCRSSCISLTATAPAARSIPLSIFCTVRETRRIPGPIAPTFKTKLTISSAAVPCHRPLSSCPDARAAGGSTAAHPRWRPRSGPTLFPRWSVAIARLRHTRAALAEILGEHGAIRFALKSQRCFGSRGPQPGHLSRCPTRCILFSAKWGLPRCARPLQPWLMGCTKLSELDRSLREKK